MSGIVLDTETTGFAKTSRVIEICVLSWADGSILLKTYLNPECAIPEEITRITGITDDMVRDAPTFRDVAPQLIMLINAADAVIGYNPGFDKGMLVAEFERLGDLLTPPRWPQLVDAKRIWDLYEPREKRDLQNAYKRFVDKEGFPNAHGAEPDATATRDVVLAQLDEFSLRGVSWEDMDPERKSWWGPTSHILIKDERLTCNFGKHKNLPIVEVDTGFWKWVTERDFPDHVLMVAIKMIDFAGEPDLEPRLTDWSRRYAEAKF